MVALLAVPDYRGAVLEGLVASIGGLDAALSKEATAALIATTNSPGEAQARLQTCCTAPLMIADELLVVGRGGAC